jgi:hypothetical protein
MTLADWDIQAASADGGLASTLDIVKTGWGVDASEMKAAIVMVGAADVVDTPVTHGNLSIGVTDGSTDGSISLVSGSGSTSASGGLFSRGGTSRLGCLMTPGSSSILGSFTLDSFIDDGLRLSIDDLYSPDDYIHTALMFAGDLDADVRLVTAAGDVDTGFKPDLCVVLSLMSLPMDDTAHAFNVITVGAFAEVDGVTETCSINYSAVWTDFDVLACNSILSSQYVANLMSNGTIFDTNVPTILPSGYRLSQAGVWDCVVLALRGRNRKMDCRCRTVPAGPQGDSGVKVRGGAVTPIARMLGGVLVAGDDTLRSNRLAGAFGLGFHTAADAFYAGFKESDGAGTTASQSITADQALWQIGYGLLGTPGAALNYKADKSSPPFGWDFSALDWEAFNQSHMQRIMDVTIGKGPATIVRGGRLFGGRIY